MKTSKLIQCLFYIHIFYFLIYSGENQWNIVKYPSELEEIVSYSGVYAFNEYEAVIVGSNGTIIVVNDNGDSMNFRNYGNQTLTAVDFSDGRRGWVIGDSGTILKTITRGNSWEKQESPVKSKLNCVEAVDSNCAWAAGDSGKMIHTIDGGRNWIVQTAVGFDTSNNADTISLYNLVSMASENNQTCWAAGYLRKNDESILLRTVDGGEHWTQIVSGDIFHRIVSITSKNTILKIATTYGFYKAKFNAINNELQIDQYISIGSSLYFSFSDSLNGFAIDYYGKVYLLNDSNVTQKYFICNWPILSVASPNSHTAWVVGMRGLLMKSIDNGEHWALVHKKEQFPKVNLNSIHFYNPQNGWITGDHGLILITYDSGKTWNTIENPIDASINLKSVYFSDSQNGCALGFSFLDEWNCKGKLYYFKSIDGGKNWATISLYQNMIDRCLDNFALNGNDVLAIFKDQFISSIDQGITWQNQQLNCREFSFSDIFPVSNDAFWAVGSYNRDGKILKFFDGGKSFDQIVSIDRLDVRQKDFASITFSNPSTGWVVGDSGLVLQSIDSGATWTRQKTPAQLRLDKIRFFNDRFGCMFGSGKIFLTTDSGDTWMDESFLSDLKINNVAFSDSANLWVVGDIGTILHLGPNKDHKFLKLLSPKADTSFCRGDSILVKWQGKGMTKVSISVSYDGGLQYTTYLISTDNDGEEKIRISANAGISDQCIVRISNLDDPTIKSESGLFSIGDVNSMQSGTMFDLKNQAPHIIGSQLHFTVIQEAPIRIAIQTIDGRNAFAYRIPLCKKGEHNKMLPLHTLTSGCYVVRVAIGPKSYVRKLFLYK